MESLTPPRPAWRDSKWLALLEFAMVAAIFLADRHHLILLSKTPYLLALGWLSLRLRKLRWSDVGLVQIRNWAATSALGVAMGAGLELFDLFGKQRFLVWLLGKQPDLSAFRAIHGNLKLSLLALVFVWTFAAFGEELIYRGYLMNRLAGLGNGTRTAWVFSLLVMSAVFGYSHAGQGITGILEEGSDGLILGLMYLRCGRTLAVPVIAHGVCDTIDVLLIFFGYYPGM